MLMQLEEYPGFFQNFDPQLYLIQISCQELLKKGDRAVATFESYLDKGLLAVNKENITAYLNMLCRQRKHLPSSDAISKKFVKFFYAGELSYQQKLALLIVYFEKARRGYLEFHYHHLNFFLDSGKNSEVYIEAFYNILCHYILEFITSANMEDVGVLFKRLLSPVKKVSNRRYRMLKSMIVTEIVKWQNKDNLELFTEFIELF